MVNHKVLEEGLGPDNIAGDPKVASDSSAECWKIYHRTKRARCLECSLLQKNARRRKASCKRENFLKTEATSWPILRIFLL